MLIIKNVNMPLESDFSKADVAKHTRIPQKEIVSFSLYKRSVDARKKDNIVFCCSFLLTVKNEAAVLKNNKKAERFAPPEYVWKKCSSDIRPVVVGFGPAGMFASLTLARAGLKPIVIERGQPVEQRTIDVRAFFGGGRLDPESNVQFGEGGAGTFSDGKLNTGIKDVRCRIVLELFAQFGADKKILYEAKPHIGTDVLVNVVKNIRNELISLGGEIRFGSRLTDITVKDGVLTHITVNGDTLPCSHLIVATGHSARDTFAMLKDRGLIMERKSFAMGARIEHLQQNINKALYGSFFDHPALGAADYKLVTHLENGRAVYTFCMCPGGEVVNASSENGGIAVNGMSGSKRDGKNANSALLVEVSPSDLDGDDVLEGIRLQRDVERAAYAQKHGAVPFCYVGDLTGVPSQKSVSPTVRPRTVHTDIGSVLPPFIANSIKAALPEFDKKISGFNDPDAVLTFPETRSSSPVRIKRDKNYNSLNVLGFYPCGEGAGYAGGIMSAAVDGMRVAEAVIEALNI